jgi:Ca-activated chloride channel family protein
MQSIRVTLLLILTGTGASLPAAATANGLLLLGDDGPVPALVRSSDVRIDVTGLLTRTVVTQRFVNPTDAWVEGRYTYALPAGAAVDELRLVIGERVIEGVVREKARAREAFEQARRTGRSAALVQQQRTNLFSTAVTHVAPGETIEVRIGYSSTVDYRDGEFRLRFPTTLMPRYDSDARGHAADTAAAPPGGEAAPVLRLAVDLDAGVNIETLRSLHHAVRTAGTGSRRQVALADPGAAEGRDFELVWTTRDRHRLQGAMFVEEFGGRAHALLMLVPPDDFRPTNLQRELVVVLDRSGSMQGEAFDQARAAVRMALQRLGPGDRFNVIAFSSETRRLFAAPMPASAGRLRGALAFLDDLRADGGTEIEPALAAAMDGLPEPGHLRQIVVATDGAITREDRILARIRDGIADARLFAVGIGHGVNDGFLARAARLGGGTLTRVAGEHTVIERMDDLLRRLERPVLEDVQIDWPVPAETWPRRLPDLYAGQPLLVAARLDTSARDLDDGEVRVTGLRGLDWIEMRWPVARFHAAPGPARAWARARVEGLALLAPGAIDETLRRDEMLLTSLDYGIVGPRTALVAVDRTPRRTRNAALQRARITGTLPADRTGLRVMPATATGATGAALRGLAILLIVALLVLQRRLNPAPRRLEADDRR